MVQTLIADRFEVFLSHSSVCQGYADAARADCPATVVASVPQQDPEAVKRWLEKEYAAIRQRSKT